jgi:hypothetical protein
LIKPLATEEVTNSLGILASLKVTPLGLLLLLASLILCWAGFLPPLTAPCELELPLLVLPSAFPEFLLFEAYSKPPTVCPLLFDLAGLLATFTSRSVCWLISTGLFKIPLAIFENKSYSCAKAGSLSGRGDLELDLSRYPLCIALDLLLLCFSTLNLWLTG